MGFDRWLFTPSVALGDGARRVVHGFCTLERHRHRARARTRARCKSEDDVVTRCFSSCSSGRTQEVEQERIDDVGFFQMNEVSGIRDALDGYFGHVVAFGAVRQLDAHATVFLAMNME